MSSWSDYFIGTSQSRYAFFAIFTALVSICIAIIFTNSDISLPKRMLVVLFLLFVSIFPVGISLFELTCMVNGGKTKSGLSLCSSYAWVVTAMIVIYCFFLVIATIVSMFTYKKAVSKIELEKHTNTISSNDANTIAQNMIGSDDKDFSSEMVGGQPGMVQNVPDIPLQMPQDEVSQQQPMEPASEMGIPPMNTTVEPFSQKKKDKMQHVENVMGHDSYDNFMQYERENFVNSPPQVAPLPNPVSKKSGKKLQSIDENEPKPYIDQIENFATL